MNQNDDTLCLNFLAAWNDYKSIDYDISVYYLEALEDHNQNMISRFGGPFGYFDELKRRRCLAADNLLKSIRSLSAAMQEKKEKCDYELLGLLSRLDKQLRADSDNY